MRCKMVLGIVGILLGLCVNPARAEEAEVASEELPVERSTIDAPDRTIQVPKFVNGKFDGYSEVPFEMDQQTVRGPTSLTAEPTDAAPAKEETTPETTE